VGSLCLFNVTLWLRRAETNPDTVLAIRNAVDAGQPLSVEILNYRKDGTPFWNRLNLIPITTATDLPLATERALARAPLSREEGATHQPDSGARRREGNPSR